MSGFSETAFEDAHPDSEPCPGESRRGLACASGLTSRAHCSGGVRGRPLVGIAPKASRADCQVAPRWINPRPACRRSYLFNSPIRLSPPCRPPYASLSIRSSSERPSLSTVGGSSNLSTRSSALFRRRSPAENSRVYEEMLDGCPGIGAGRSILFWTVWGVDGVTEDLRWRRLKPRLKNGWE